MRPDTKPTPTTQPKRDGKQYDAGAHEPEAQGQGTTRQHYPNGHPGQGGQSTNGAENPEPRETQGLVDPRRETGRDILGPPSAPAHVDLTETRNDDDALLEDAPQR